tara:strand:+ start:1231 stop:1581 length:351 start_codon:yes stop_codon:yes gene_type:complete
MVIKSMDDVGVESLSNNQKMLLGTLSMLCSFLSVKDFCSFIFSEKFVDLMKYDLDLKFEIGLYTNHEITLQLSGKNEYLIIDDLLDHGCFENGRVECRSNDDFESAINIWLAIVLV